MFLNLYKFVGFVGSEVFTAVVAVFWDIAPCSPYMNRCFRGTYRLHRQGLNSAEQETSVEADC
jgi:hypothetical protein